MFGGNTAELTAALNYAKANGGTVAVSSQTGASSSIIQSGANVVALGGFSGRESQVSIEWLAQAVRAGQVRYRARRLGWRWLQRRRAPARVT